MYSNFWLRNARADEGCCRAADGKVPLPIASSQARTTTSSVFDADTGWKGGKPWIQAEENARGRIWRGFCELPSGDGGGVISGYACGGLVPMWESGDGSGSCGGLGPGGGGTFV